MRFKQLGAFGVSAGALLLASALTSTASAATVNITATAGILNDLEGASYTSDGFAYRSGQTFFDTFLFDLSAPSQVHLDIASTTSALKGLRFTQIQLFPAVAAFTPATDSPLSFSFDNLQAGTYLLTLSGLATGTLGGSYHFDLYTQPVPEPTAIALLLAGMGVVFAATRRRTH